MAHVEAGLRSFDRTMPEEINRIVADEFSDYLFIHSEEASDNLRAEGIASERIHFVGNTMIDTLVAMEERFRALGAAEQAGLRPGDYLLVTLHRPALVDGPLLFDVLDELGRIARELPVVFPLHPRTRKMLEHHPVDPAVRLLEPVGYLEFLSLQADAAGVLTDSGGVQEETTYLGVPCFTLRDNTERPVTVTGRNQHAARTRSFADRRDPARARAHERQGAHRAAGVGWPRRREARRGDLRRPRRRSAERQRRPQRPGEGSRMKVWIDFSNSPHPLLFAPVARRLEAEGPRGPGHRARQRADDRACAGALARRSR